MPPDLEDTGRFAARDQRPRSAFSDWMCGIMRITLAAARRLPLCKFFSAQGDPVNPRNYRDFGVPFIAAGSGILRERADCQAGSSTNDITVCFRKLMTRLLVTSESGTLRRCDAAPFIASAQRLAG
jgi:hypothetical protein